MFLYILPSTVFTFNKKILIITTLKIIKLTKIISFQMNLCVIEKLFKPCYSDFQLSVVTTYLS